MRDVLRTTVDAHQSGAIAMLAVAKFEIGRGVVRPVAVNVMNRLCIA